MDSMQVYRGMDIGTAKPSPAVRRQVRHHMIDVVEPSDEFTVTEYQQAARIIIHDAGPDARLLVVGGSGLHFRSIVDPMTFAPTDPQIRADMDALSDEEARALLLARDQGADDVMDTANPRRVARALEVLHLTGESPTERARSREALAVRAYKPLIAHVSIGIDAGDLAKERADERFQAMVASGFLDEVERLQHVMGRTASQAVGYRELLEVVRGTDTLASAIAKAQASTRHLVKRQRTYFGRDPRIVWLPWQDDAEQRVEAVVQHIERETSWIS